MKTTYETFAELAEAMTDGGGILHHSSPHSGDDCMPWQHGVKDFAGWLDHIGVKVSVSDGAEDFYAYVRRKTK